MKQARFRRAVTAILVLAATGCGALDVSDPTKIEDGDLANGSGAALLRGDALKQFYKAMSLGALETGLISDELFAENPPGYEEAGLEWDEIPFDRRDSPGLAESGRPYSYAAWQTARRAATIAMIKLRTFGTPAQVGEMYAFRAYAELNLAEQACSGIPLHDLNGLTPVYSGPRTTEQVFERALADFDSALALAADSARIMDLARIGKARSLVGLGRFDEVAAVTAPVLDDYTSEASYSTSADRNQFEAFYYGYYLVRSVADGEGGTGLDFVTAGDPRVAVDSVGTAPDGVTIMYNPSKYTTPNDPIIVASGTEARLLDAEAAFHTGGDWRGILNTLRATVSGLTVLPDPGNDAARVDLIFRERAFWLYGTGHRIGDLRRLVAQYGRSVESVFPSGAYRLGGTYAAGTSIPFDPTRDSGFNPAITGCTSW